MAVETPDWMARAACRSLHGDVFFPPMEVAPEVAALHYDIGRSVCASCPVWHNCLNVGRKEAWGLWGGLTPHERVPLTNPDTTKHLAHHGTTARYRQGCRCDDCVKAHEENSSKTFKLSLIPLNTSKFGDVTLLHEELFRDSDPVK